MAVGLKTEFSIEAVYQNAVQIYWDGDISLNGENQPQSWSYKIKIVCKDFFGNTITSSSTEDATSIFIKGLNPGEKYNIDATISMTYNYANTGDTTISYSHTAKCYTHPGEWNWSFVSGTIIQENLSAEKVFNWVQHLKKYICWENQKELTEEQKEKYSKYYDPSIEEDTKEKSRSGLLVNSGDVIYLEWFNNCVKEKHGNETNLVLTRENNGDLITATVFNELLNFDSYKYE